MWWLLLSSSFVLSLSSSAVLVNEIYYDHPGADDGREFVEIVNNGPGSVALAGWSLEVWDAGGDAWEVLWQGAAGDTAAAGGVFAIGGNAVRPVPPVVLSFALHNTSDAIRLVDHGVEVDRVGYGALGDPLLFEGTSAPDVDAGSSLGRFPDGLDSDDNARDFHALEPSPGRLNRPRRNVALSPVSALRAEAPPGGGDLIEVRASNAGLDVIGAGFLTVTVVDTGAAESALASTTNDIAIAPEKAWVAVLPVRVRDNYTVLRVTVFYAQDERPGDNVVTFVRRLGGVDILVSEVMSDPPDGCPEYVELFNTSATARNLADYRVRDRVSAPSLLTGRDVFVDAGGYVALTDDAALLHAWFPQLHDSAVLEVEGAWPSLNHSGSGEADSVVVQDAFGIPADQVAYPPQPSGARGRSLERVDLFSGRGPHTWVVSQDPARGTPGAPNGRTIERPTAAAAVTVAPNPLDPARGESLFVTVPERDGAAGARVQVYDIDGRRVADLGSSSRLPFVYVWNGRDGAEHDVVPGFYVVACEYLSLDFRVQGVERVVVGCARKKK